MQPWPSTGDTLVFDLGLHRAEDTAYYLRLGCRVVAVEADVGLAAQARERFRAEIAAGRLVILNRAVTGESGESVDFHVSDYTMWSSADVGVASREQTRTRTIRVAAITLPELLMSFGLPKYCKIDLEGSDADVIAALAEYRVSRPFYLSAETECAGDEPLDDDGALRVLMELARAGYRRFKLVDQETLIVLGDDLNFYPRRRDAGWRGELRRRRESLRRKLLGRRAGYRFPPGASGPFGHALGGRWVSFDRACGLLLAHRAAFFAGDAPAHGFWCDWHASL
jgi:FkbM family methyltransferase